MALYFFTMFYEPSLLEHGKQFSRGKMKTEKSVTLSSSNQINKSQRDTRKNSLLWKQYIGKEDAKNTLKFGEQG